MLFKTAVPLHYLAHVSSVVQAATLKGLPTLITYTTAAAKTND